MGAGPSPIAISRWSPAVSRGWRCRRPPTICWKRSATRFAQPSQRVLSSEGDSLWTSPSRARSIASRSVATIHSVAKADRMALGVGRLPSAQEGAHPRAQARLWRKGRGLAGAHRLRQGSGRVRLDRRGRRRRVPDRTLQSGILFAKPLRLLAQVADGCFVGGDPAAQGTVPDAGAGAGVEHVDQEEYGHHAGGHHDRDPVGNPSPVSVPEGHLVGASVLGGIQANRQQGQNQQGQEHDHQEILLLPVYVSLSVYLITATRTTGRLGRRLPLGALSADLGHVAAVAAHTLAALAAGLAGLIGAELVGRALGVGGATALLRNLALLVGLH